MKLSNFPDQGGTFLGDDETFQEWAESLPALTKNVEGARQHFMELTSLAWHDNLKFQQINRAYVYILKECIDFSENKRKTNDKIGKNINEDIYTKLTGRHGYTGTLGIANFVCDVFTDPSLYDETSKEPSLEKNSYLTRDAFEQAYRICEYVLAYLEMYSKDHRLVDELEKTARELTQTFGKHQEYDSGRAQYNADSAMYKKL